MHSSNAKGVSNGLVHIDGCLTIRCSGRRALLFLVVVWLNACSTLSPIGQPGTTAGQRVDQPGVSFTPPDGKTWSVLMRSTYQVVLGAQGSGNETYVTSVNVYQLPGGLSPEQFLAHVKTGRAAEPQTGRFELISNNEQPYTDRPEVCVKHRAISKDYGARRGGDFTLVDYLGMNCIHPSSPQVGVFVELSRKAATPADASFDADGIRLLRSVAFAQFK